VTESAREARTAVSAAPALRQALGSLLEADFAVQIRKGRALLLSSALPLILLFASSAGKRAAVLGSPRVRVAACLTVGIATIAVIGYSMSVARDRDRGVFQRLRVTPTAPWAIMVSRLTVQVASILVMTVILLVAAAIFENVTLDPGAYALTLVVVVFGSAVFLSVGQALVGLVRSADTVNGIGRLVYIPLVALGVFGHLDVLGTTFETIARWSPSGAVATMLSGSMDPASWSSDTWLALLASVAYSVLFAGIGIRWFQWSGH
jgi:ABC-2 type transport system permease protein